MHRRTRRTAASFVAPVLAALAASALCALPACSGAQAINLSGDAGGGSGSGSGGGSGGGSGSSSGSSAEDSGSGVIDSGQPSMDAVAVEDVTEVDTAPVEEPTPTGPAVSCPMQGVPSTCQAGDLCCVVGSAMEGNQTDTCQSPSDACMGTPVHCAVPADCPGQICCGTEQTVANVTTYTQVACASTCALSTQRTFCDPSNPVCPANAPTCGASQLLPGYNVCQM